jgi:prepilin-type N-terminal cleavage/methylation domain-containing protein
MEMVKSWDLAYRNREHRPKNGFTLIEMAVVLVVIGLIVGGVLVGQDLIRAAGVRATISQIEKYNTAANTFREKYDYLPGDIKDPDASNFGFAARGLYPGEGDGNGIIETNHYGSSTVAYEVGEAVGETVMFWVDLSAAHMIDGSFNTASPSEPIEAAIEASSVNPSISSMLPQAKLGNGNYIYVYGGGVPNTGVSNGINHFGISAITEIGTGDGVLSNPGLTVKQAYAIDTKIDDGLPQLGRVTAIYANGYTGAYGDVVWSGIAGTGMTPASSTTCYDNGNVFLATQHYSVEFKDGAGVNCGLSIDFQAGD